MKTTVVSLASMIPVGKVNIEIVDSILNMTTTRAIHDVGYNIRRDKIDSYAAIPGQYCLPLRIDVRCSIDTPELLLLIGAGHISVGSPWMENRRIEDIAEPKGKPKIFDNAIPFNEMVDISVVLGLKEMQIQINGEERYYSTKERYMKSKYFQERNVTGFSLGITCTKRAMLRIQSIGITEYEATPVPISHSLGVNDESSNKDKVEAGKPTFDSCIENLPPEIKKEIIETDQFLKSLRGLKFRRTIEKHGNKITYVEPTQGVSYALYLSDNVMHHSLQFYIITNSKSEHWHRKGNPLEALLEEIDNKNPKLAERIFYNLNECIGCGDACMVRTQYTFHSQSKLTCHGNVFFKMCISDFEDVREFFKYLLTFTQRNGLS